MEGRGASVKGGAEGAGKSGQEQHAAGDEGDVGHGVQVAACAARAAPDDAKAVNHASLA